MIDARGHFVMPGFIEGHGHFSGLGFSLVNLNFLNDRSWEAIIAKVEERAGNTPKAHGLRAGAGIRKNGTACR
ncbi:MAG: amidohydrolase family protein [Saprospiraceae bacterium]|nr:amidohydrolase family protein [Saprospiraceae bacterium]